MGVVQITETVSRDIHQTTGGHAIDGCYQDGPLFALNHELNRIRLPLDANEGVIETILHELEDIGPHRRWAYWLMLARVAEMALVCAGHYADHFEFQAAGDLLMNPRRILIYQKSRAYPTVKNRHGRLSEQLKTGGHPGPKQRTRLGREVTLKIDRPALLPYLCRQMQQSGQLAPGYLDSLEKRMEQVADTIGFLCAGSLADSEALHGRMQGAPPKARRFMQAHLCNFDARLFRQLGTEIKRLQLQPDYQSTFLA